MLIKKHSWAICFSAVFSLFSATPLLCAQPNLPPTPTSTNTYTSSGVTNYAYIYQCEYATNFNGTIVTAIYSANITNMVQVNQYPKMLEIQLKTKSRMQDSWEDFGEPIIIKLGFVTNGYYTAELTIE